MFIEGLKIQGFRSLYDVEVYPGSFTVLAGANNAGKTTLADALDFLADIHRFRLEVAISRKGGFENLAFRRMRRTRRPVSMSVQVVMDLAEIPTLARRIRARDRSGDTKPQFVVSHSFSFKAASDAIAADYLVTEETLVIDYRDGASADSVRFASVERQGKAVITKVMSAAEAPSNLEVLTSYNDELEYLRARKEIDATVLLVEALAFHPVLRQLQRALSGMRVYQLSPLESRRAGVPTPNPALERHGENLPAMVDFLRKRARGPWKQVFTAMQRIVPNLTDISTSFSTDRRLVLQFKERGVGRPWNANEISDGTIQSLALFCALFDPRTTLAFIEEPENSVHPWIVRIFADACREAAKRGRQIFVTTHSPALLQRAVPSEVKLIWRHDGRSSVAPLLELDPEAEKLWDTGDIDVFELLDSGVLRQAVPEGSA